MYEVKSLLFFELAKINKNYEKADVIRDDLMKKGIEIMDSSSGTTWKIKS